MMAVPHLTQVNAALILRVTNFLDPLDGHMARVEKNGVA